MIYFGLRFSARGIQPTGERVKAIRDAPTPFNVTELHSFIGLLAALINFIPKLSTLARPLNELLGNKPWKWTSSCDQAFGDIKYALTLETTLTHNDPGLLVELSVDASPYGLGAVIMHDPCIEMEHAVPLPMDREHLTSMKSVLARLIRKSWQSCLV